MKIKIQGKKGFQISFAWLFAIIVGAFIIFLAIFASVKLIGTEQEISNVETSKEIGVLTNVLETGFESSSTASLEIALETRIGNNCEKPGNFEPFGIQGIQLAQKSLNKWSEVGTEIVFRNRYIFSEDIVEGKKFYMFSKSFDFPFEVSSVIYLTSAEKNYCFVGLEESEDIEEEIIGEISNLNQKNLFVEDCPSSSINVCFGTFDSECDIEVNLNQKYVEKEESGRVYFETNVLMYGAIFSEKNGYECQVKRLMQRLSVLANTYDEKESLLYEKQSCPQERKALELSAEAGSLTNSRDLINVKKITKEVDKINDRAVCKLW